MLAKLLTYSSRMFVTTTYEFSHAYSRMTDANSAMPGAPKRHARR